MKRVFLCIFTCLLAIFIMSHNVGAIELTQDVNLIRGNMVINGSCIDCTNLTSASTPYGTIYFNNNVDLSAVIRDFRFTFDNQVFNNGDYFTFDVYIISDVNNNSLDAWVKSLRTPTNGWDLVDVDFSEISSGSGKLTLTFRIYINGTYNNIEIASSSNSWLNLYYKEYITYGIGTQWRPAQGVNYTQDLQNVVNAINSQPNYSQTLNNINNSINNLPSAQDNAEAIADEEEQRTQDVVDESQQDSQDSQDDVDQATSSLLAVGGQVVGVITNTPASNCNIPMNFAHFNVGVVNVCSNVPTAVLDIVRGVSALVFVPIIVNYAIYLVHKLVYLYRSFQE